ncbi:MAG: heat shock protein HspQ [Planctomycetota bacterium]
MTTDTDLPHLLRLLDDDSEVVQKAVVERLIAMGPGLEEELRSMENVPRPASSPTLRRALEVHRRARWVEAWPDWLEREPGLQKLEDAFQLLADYQHDGFGPVDLAARLDALADGYRRQHGQARKADQEELLAAYLFGEGRLGGDRERYFDPRNSDLVHVIASGTGLPISLVAIYMLVGARLGSRIEGCNVPRHFLALVETGERSFLVDCFNRGRIMDEQQLGSLGQAVTLEDFQRLRAEPEDILARVLGNLRYAYDEDGQPDNAAFIAGLLEDLAREDLEVRLFPLFFPGQIVRHKRYGYRGVVVDLDSSCQAPDDWYQSNQTQPDRDQPWYHVLVDDSNQVTYAAESSLLEDETRARISHPLVSYFFDGFEQGRYQRNDRPWRM